MLQSFKMALKSIWGNKMRSFLTMLGIIIGVAAVIILVSVVNGYMASIVESFANMGVNQISVNVTNMSSRSLDVDEMYEFVDEHPDLYERMSPQVSVQVPLKNGNDTMSSSIRGYSEDYLGIKDWEMDTGRNLSYSDCSAERKVAVMGYYTAVTMFGSAEDAIGERIKIGANAFTVVGVVERQDEDDFEDGGTDDFVWIPYTAAAKMGRSTSVTSYVITSVSTDNSEECTDTLEQFLFGIFKDDDYYSVTAMSEMLDELNKQIHTMSLMLGAIAGISLLVAGVGVMNIMLVSVTERTREIGIRKALGAKQLVIMEQFVIEAAVTSSIGGLIGIVIGVAVTGIAGAAMGITATPSVGAILLSFGVSVGIGLLFGYMPAKRAARLNPIDALRSE